MRLVRPVEVTDSVLTSSNIAENDYAAYNAGTTYALGARVINVAANVHEVYESLQGSNTGHALTEAAWWVLVGATKRWKPFDQVVQDQAENANSITYTFVPGRIDTISLRNVEAISAQVTVTDAVEGVVFDKTQSLISTSGITNWYEYFFEPIVRDREARFDMLPPYANATITVTLSASGETVKLGELVMGLSRNLGATEWGISLGIQDYSLKEQDEWGNYRITERAYADRGRFTFVIPNTDIGAIKRLLADYRATPALYIGADEIYAAGDAAAAATDIYGFFKDFEIVVPSHPDSICQIELESLT